MVADDRAHPDQHAAPEPDVAREVRARVDDAAGAERRVVADERAAAEQHVRPEFGLGADHGQRADDAAGLRAAPTG